MIDEAQIEQAKAKIMAALESLPLSMGDPDPERNAALIAGAYANAMGVDIVANPPEVLSWRWEYSLPKYRVIRRNGRTLQRWVLGWSEYRTRAEALRVMRRWGPRHMVVKWKVDAQAIEAVGRVR